MNLAVKLVSIGTITLIGMTAFLWFGWPAAAFMAMVAGIGISLVSVIRFIQKKVEESKVDRVIYEDSLKTRIENLPQTRVETESCQELADEYAQRDIYRNR